MSIQYQEKSKHSKAGIALVSVFIALAVLALAYSVWRYMELGSVALAEILIEGIILFVLVSQAVGTYTVTLTESDLIIDEVGLLGKKRMVIPYAMMNGVYRFKQSMMPPLKFRYKYRKLSSTDDRPVWALAYSVVEGKKLKHGRVLLKAEQEFFDVLAQHVPNLIQVKEDQVVFHAYLREDAFKHGEDFERYAANVYGQGQAETAESKE
ncbi:hypothetical protein [Veillonella sp. 3310]|jgi:hypothetical protein|uniref:hypothetical protein n=1 Tax=Veillonella sp. 3310 TaxID=2490956 RepID=UPI000FD65401|nr:hypothetical protein [Veillonella sp. 3310]